MITRNPRRMDKKLWTDRAGGAPLELVVARDERDEAGRIADMVRVSLARDVPAHEIAVFYRTNAQSRVIEDAFRLARIPHAVVRGRSFYDRAEVKDLAAYLRLAVNPRSDQDALRVINRSDKLVGFDVCEVAPPLDPSGRTERLAGICLLSILGDRFLVREPLASQEDLAKVFWM